MHEVDKFGIGSVVQKALDHVNPERDAPIHLSFDVDAMDPTVAPSTGTPVRGGLTFREGTLLLFPSLPSAYYIGHGGGLMYRPLHHRGSRRNGLFGRYRHHGQSPSPL